MKFQYLKIGQQFRYQGETYVKTTPLVASHAESGANKLIPRYAEIELLATTNSTEFPSPPRPRNQHQIHTILEHHHELCLGAIRDAFPQIDAAAMQPLETKLDALHTQLLQLLTSQQ